MKYLDNTGLEYYHSKIKENLKNYYGTCTTAAATQAKEVTCSGFKLETGARISVKFTNAQTYNGTATLNINSTGAKNICRVGTTTTTRYYWSAGEVVDFVYDGTNYVMQGKGVATTTYYGVTKLSSSTSSTSTSLAATPSAVKAAYDLANGKQDALVSGTNIKTINGESLLGEGDITISSGGSSTATVIYENSSGSQAGLLTLGATAHNYKRVDYFYKIVDSETTTPLLGCVTFNFEQLLSVGFSNPVYTTVVHSFYANEKNIQNSCKMGYYNGVLMLNSYSRTVHTGTSSTTENTNNFYILKVVVYE